MNRLFHGSIFQLFDMEKLGKVRRHHRKERLKISKIAKFECDLLKTSEDIASQTGEILQTFVWWGAQTCPCPQKLKSCKRKLTPGGFWWK